MYAVQYKLMCMHLYNNSVVVINIQNLYCGSRLMVTESVYFCQKFSSIHEHSFHIHAYNADAMNISHSYVNIAVLFESDRSPIVIVDVKVYMHTRGDVITALCSDIANYSMYVNLSCSHSHVTRVLTRYYDHAYTHIKLFNVQYMPW